VFSHNLSTGTSSNQLQYGSPYINGGGGWGIFNGILGWQNSATYGSVISYNVYWIFISALFYSMRYNEVKGHWPLAGSKKTATETRSQDFATNLTPSDSTGNDIVDDETREKNGAGIRATGL
jgi:high-affinity iron transporter